MGKEKQEMMSTDAQDAVQTNEIESCLPFSDFIYYLYITLDCVEEPPHCPIILESVVV